MVVNMIEKPSIDFCIFEENAPAYLCITGSKYGKSGVSYVHTSEVESLSTRLSRKFNLSIVIINAILKAHPTENPDVAIEKYGPSPDLHPLNYYGQKRYRAMKLMKPSWELGEHKRYSQAEFERCRAIVEKEDAKKKQSRENFNRKVQIKHRRKNKDGTIK